MDVKVIKMDKDILKLFVKAKEMADIDKALEYKMENIIKDIEKTEKEIEHSMNSGEKIPGSITTYLKYIMCGLKHDIINREMDSIRKLIENPEEE